MLTSHVGFIHCKGEWHKCFLDFIHAGSSRNNIRNVYWTAFGDSSIFGISANVQAIYEELRQKQEEFTPLKLHYLDSSEYQEEIFNGHVLFQNLILENVGGDYRIHCDMITFSPIKTPKIDINWKREGF